MAQDRRPSIKDDATYDALRSDGHSRESAARIANAQANDDMAPSEKGGKAAPYEDWTRDALYARAQELDVDGRSDMTRAELIDTLRST
ncbi:MAG: Rho termination factor [Pseudomonadota bacterium]